MHRLTRVVAFVLAALLASPLPLRAAQEAVMGPDVWRAFAQSLDVGQTVAVRLKNGQRFKATLLQASDEAMTLQPKTRVPVPPQRVPFAEVEAMEVQKGGGIGVGKALAIGIASGVGTFLGMLAILFATVGD